MLDIEATTRDQCEGPFGPFLSDEERAEYEAFLARLASVPEDEEEPGWVAELDSELPF